VGSAELGLPEARLFTERARAAGVDATLEVWLDMVHVWHAFAARVPEAAAAVERVGSYLRDRSTKSRRSPTVASLARRVRPSTRRGYTGLGRQHTGGPAHRRAILIAAGGSGVDPDLIVDDADRKVLSATVAG